MATPQRPAQQRSGATTKSPTGPQRSKVVWVTVAIVALLAALAGVIAVLSSGGGSDNASPGVSTSVPGGTVEQSRPVTVEGAPLAALPDGGTDPAVGATAPVLHGQSFDGAPVDVTPGKPTLVLLLAHWCPHCRREVPALVKWQQQGKMPAGLEVIGIATGTEANAPNYPPSAWLASEKFPWPVIADTADQQAATALGLSGFPFYVLIDAKGTVVWRGSGEMDPAALTATINAKLAG